MKTKLLLLITVAASILAISCQKGPSEGRGARRSLDGAVGFSAYTSIPVTRGTEVSADSVQTGGFGVFAFYQAAVDGQPILYNSRKAVTPDFMYNQKVVFSNSSWTYTPTKYWPNNVGGPFEFLRLRSLQVRPEMGRV